MKQGTLFLVMLLIGSTTFAHQPIMDMAPRWKNGYGAQVRVESYGSKTLLNGSDKIDNPLGLERFVTKYWLEGVYTFERSLRVTAKLPYVDQQRIKSVSGAPIKQSNSGIGDLILAAPLKKYHNGKHGTSNLGLTPQVRLPTGSSDGDFPISDGSIDFGLSASYSSESYPFGSDVHLKTYQLYDVFYWVNNEGKNGMEAGNVFGIDINFGLHPYHNDNQDAGIFTVIDLSYRNSEAPSLQNLTTASGGSRLHGGPVLIFYKDNYMFRIEYKFPIFEKADGISNSRGNELQVLLGFTG